MKKKMFAIFVVWILLLWGIHVFKLNRNVAVTDEYIEMGEGFIWNGIDVCPKKVYLYTDEEYKSNMGVEPVDESMDCDRRIICLKLKMTNNTGEDVEWSRVMDNLGYGFESINWCSAVDPFLTSSVNIFYTKTFENGASQDIWLITTINEICFTEKHWRDIEQVDFYYVLNIQPHKLRIKLKLT
jgi:hypothetical protein